MRTIDEVISIVTRLSGDEDAAKLRRFFEKTGFETAPASTRFHGCRKGGLWAHCDNVANLMVAQNAFIETGLSDDELVLLGFVHSLSQAGIFIDKRFVARYIENPRFNPEDPVVPANQPYNINPAFPHESKDYSIEYAGYFEFVTPDMLDAIKHRSGPYTKSIDKDDYLAHRCSTLAYLLHAADMISSKFTIRNPNEAQSVHELLGRTMTKEEFVRRWQSDEDGGGITFDDIADCAVEWGIISSRPKTQRINAVVNRVLEHLNLPTVSDNGDI